MELGEFFPGLNEGVELLDLTESEAVPGFRISDF
jgi:hypothetical protein